MKNRKTALRQQEQLDKELNIYLERCKKRGQTPRQRFFTKEFQIGQKVYVVRTEHGWHDCRLSGIITNISLFGCIITDEEGSEYFINHPRDIRGE